mmetsp:Transcript_15903/g.39325  ORF Transcript_15903/g.39325 Transcript_15903/m.39325 type:complete len:307 (-) Transcript_15903:16566-17486(-)
MRSVRAGLHQLPALQQGVRRQNPLRCAQHGVMRGPRRRRPRPVPVQARVQRSHVRRVRRRLLRQQLFGCVQRNHPLLGQRPVWRRRARGERPEAGHFVLHLQQRIHRQRLLRVRQCCDLQRPGCVRKNPRAGATREPHGDGSAALAQPAGGRRERNERIQRHNRVEPNRHDDDAHRGKHVGEDDERHPHRHVPLRGVFLGEELRARCDVQPEGHAERQSVHRRVQLQAAVLRYEVRERMQLLLGQGADERKYRVCTLSGALGYVQRRKHRRRLLHVLRRLQRNALRDLRRLPRAQRGLFAELHAEL